jgi:hypothetical protein
MEGLKWRGDDEEHVSSYRMALKETRGYWELKEEALDRTVWKIFFGKGYGPVVRQDSGWVNE